MKFKTKIPDRGTAPHPSIVFRVNEDIYLELKQRAKEARVSMTELCRQMIEHCLKEMREQDK